MGKEGGVITSAASTLMEIVPEIAELPWESVTFTVKEYVLGITDPPIGPVMVPLLPRLRPVGKVLAPAKVHVKGPTPPVCVSGVE